MKLVVDAESYVKAVETIGHLIGVEADCVLKVSDGKAVIEASNDEAWLRFSLKVESIEGEGKAFTKVQHLKVIKPSRATKTLTLSYEGEDHISVQMARTRGAIRTIEEDEAHIQRPVDSVKLGAVAPAKLVRFATGATAFKPLLDSSNPNAIIKLDNQSFDISSFDIYIGTHYETTDEQIKTREGPFQLVVDMSYWEAIVSRIGVEGNIRLGADERNFRIKSDTFDLYHAVLQEDVQDVKEVISTLRSGDSHLAVVEFDGNAVTEAIAATKGIIQSGDKDGASFFITIKRGIAILSAESAVGEMEADFDITGFDGEEDVEFRVRSTTFTDILRLTRDEAMKYGPVRLTILDQHLVLESLKVSSSSVSPVLQD